MPDVKPKILVVDDDATFRTRLVRALTSRGFETFEAADVDGAVARAKELKPQRAIVDLRMPGGRSGLDLISELMAIDEEIEILVLTGYGSIATAVEAVRRGAIDYLNETVNTEQILAVFDRESAAAPLVAADVTEAKPSLARVEWEHIQRVLSDCGGKISEA